MNNNFNQNNGQFGGWANNSQNTPNNYQMPYGNQGNWNYQSYNEQQMKNQEKKKDKKFLRKMGNWFGICIVAYVVLARISAYAIYFLSKAIPSLDLLYENSTASYAYSTVGSILFIGVPFLIAYLVLKKGKIAGNLPFGTAYNGKAAVYLVLLFVPVTIFSSIIVNMISLIVQAMLGLTFTSGLEDLTIDGVGGFIISVFSMAVVPAIIEEFAVRGVILQPLRRYGDRFAIISSAFIFSIMHGNMVQIPYTMIGGIILGYITVATGSIWPSIIVHFVNNMYSVVALAATSFLGDTMSNVVVALLLAVFVIMGIVGGIGFFTMNYKTTLAKGVNTLKTSEKTTSLFLNIPMIIGFIIMLVYTVKSVE